MRCSRCQQRRGSSGQRASPGPGAGRLPVIEVQYD